MRSVRPATIESLPNLLFNGGFDQAEAGRPAGWTFRDFTLTAAPAVARGALRTSAVQDAVEDLVDYLELTVPSANVGLRQSFLADPAVSVLDFPAPLAAGSERQAVAGGYLSLYERLLARRAHTCGLSVRVRAGRVRLDVKFFGVDGRTVAEGVAAERLDAALTQRRWARYSAILTPVATPAAFELTVTRLESSEPAVVDVGNLQLIVGAYEEAPYTGDPWRAAFPSDIGVLFMGTACPPGWTALAEDGAAPDEWTAADPTAGSRRGAFPRGRDGAALTGAPSHNRETVRFELATDDVIALESFDGRFGGVVNGQPTYDPNARVPADEPDEQGRADHQHNLRAGGSLPVHRGFLFCRKL